MTDNERAVIQQAKHDLDHALTNPQISRVARSRIEAASRQLGWLLQQKQKVETGE